MAGPVLWGPNSTANNLENNLQFANGAGPTIQAPATPVDPSSVATAGNAGDIYINNSIPAIFVKQDAGTTTNWLALIGVTGGVQSYIATSTASQTIINFGYNVNMLSATDQAAFQLIVDGKVLTQGASYDYQFTNIISNLSNQVTLNTAIIAGLPIQALKFSPVSSGGGGGGLTNAQVQAIAAYSY